MASMDVSIFKEPHILYSELMCTGSPLPPAIDFNFTRICVLPNSEEVEEGNQYQVCSCWVTGLVDDP